MSQCLRTPDFAACCRCREKPEMRCLLLLSLLLTGAALTPSPSFSVFVARPQYLVFAGDIRTICGSATFACTDITAIELRASCRKTDEAWEPTAAVAFAPVIHLPVAGPGETHKILVHEFAHIHDFYRSSEAYARTFTQRRFASEGECRAVTIREEAVFNSRMAEFGRRSVALRR
jgi:hypothetical protein